MQQVTESFKEGRLNRATQELALLGDIGRSVRIASKSQKRCGWRATRHGRWTNIDTPQVVLRSWGAARTAGANV